MTTSNTSTMPTTVTHTHTHTPFVWSLFSCQLALNNFVVPQKKAHQKLIIIKYINNRQLWHMNSVERMERQFVILVKNCLFSLGQLFRFFWEGEFFVLFPWNNNDPGEWNWHTLGIYSPGLCFNWTGSTTFVQSTLVGNLFEYASLSFHSHCIIFDISDQLGDIWQLWKGQFWAAISLEQVGEGIWKDKVNRGDSVRTVKG